MKSLILYISLLSTVWVFPLTTNAHPGSLDSYGGHVCVTNCAYWGEIYGTWHYHGYQQSPSVSGVPLSYEAMHELVKDNPDYKKIKNGYKLGNSITCKDGYKKVEEECVDSEVKLTKSSTSLSDPAVNTRLRLIEALKKGQYSTLEDMTEKQLNSYADDIVEIVPDEKIKEHAPEWFVKKYLKTSKATPTSSSSREELLKQIQVLMELIVKLKAKQSLN